MPTLYVETNFLVGFAKGQDTAAADLLRDKTSPIRIVLPDICVMEAFRVMEVEQKQRRTFIDALGAQVREARRQEQPVHAGDVVKALEDAIRASESLASEIRGRVHDGLGMLFPRRTSAKKARSEMISFTSKALRGWYAGGGRGLIEDLTDDLVLGCVLADAGKRKDERKAFLSANSNDFDVPEVNAALARHGVRYFRSTSNAVGWLTSSRAS
jgi:hypothetical protein